LEKGSFPFFILFLDIDPHRVDVNVHPSKMEVKFEDESSMYRYVLSTVRKALSQHDLVPMVEIRKDERAINENVGLKFQQGSLSTQRAFNWRELLRAEPAADAKQIPEYQAPVQSADSGSSANKILQDKYFSETSLRGGSPVAQQSQQVIEKSFAREATEHVWQVHNKYIIIPTEEGIMLVDQHAAHERVLYERAIERFDRTHTKSQQLLFPHTIVMTPGDAALVRQLQSLLEALGFSLKFFGKTTVIVDGVPVDVTPGQEGSILQHIIDRYKEDEHDLKLEPRVKLAKSFSCKAAIKAGDPLNHAEICSLLDQLFRTQIPYVCPHGRPVIVKLSLAELDRRFGRTS
jgi:DNA mismatch repair protein MutL